MKLTQKDKNFLEILRILIESKELWVELRLDRPSRMVLRGTYGDSIHRRFRMTRQGVRWRFWRLFNEIYVSAFETILFLETTFGAQLREHALRISRERYELRQKMAPNTLQQTDLLRPGRENRAQSRSSRDDQK